MSWLIFVVNINFGQTEEMSRVGKECWELKNEEFIGMQMQVVLVSPSEI